MKNIVANMEALARKWHRGAVRQGLIGVPYIQHPEAVVALLKQWGYDEKRDAETLAIAWGHNLLEDTKASKREIVAAALCGCREDRRARVMDGLTGGIMC